MGNFIIGTIFGIIVSQLGFSGVAKILDKAMYSIQEIAVDYEQSKR
jgi:hypothetical protein